jgi:hypothetical protein
MPYTLDSAELPPDFKKWILKHKGKVVKIDPKVAETVQQNARYLSYYSEYLIAGYSFRRDALVLAPGSVKASWEAAPRPDAHIIEAEKVVCFVEPMYGGYWFNLKQTPYNSLILCEVESSYNAYPHKCPTCNAPAYVGFNVRIDCSNTFCIHAPKK